MKLVFYRDKNSGKLFNYHKLPEKMTESKVKEAICQINSNPKEKSTVELIELNEHSEFLLKKAEEKRCFFSKCIQEAIDALDNAKDCINCLRPEEVK